MIQLFKEQLESVLNPMMQLLDSNLGSRCELIVCEVTAERNLKIIMSRNASVEHEVGFIFNGLDMNLLEENHGFLTGGTVSVGGKLSLIHIYTSKDQDPRDPWLLLFHPQQRLPF